MAETNYIIITYQSLLEDYLCSRVLRARSAQNYRYVMGRLEREMDVPIDQIERGRLLDWRRRELDRGVQPVSWNNYVRHLRALFNHGMDQGLLPYTQNPFFRMTVTTPKKPKKTLDSEQIVQIQRLFDELEAQEEAGDMRGRLHPVWFWRAAVATFYFTGIRLNQLLHLRPLDVDLRRQLIHIRIEGSKTHGSTPCRSVRNSCHCSKN